MTFLDRVGNEINVGDFLVYVTAGDRHPVLEFGFVEKFHETKNWNGDPSGTKIKFQKATPEGQRYFQTVEDTPAHWRVDTPQKFIDYDNAHYGTRDSIMSHDEWRKGYLEYYVRATRKNTDKPETTMLELIETKDINGPRYNNRMWVVQPV